jgi:hypothetical protein
MRPPSLAPRTPACCIPCRRLVDKRGLAPTAEHGESAGAASLGCGEPV